MSPIKRRQKPPAGRAGRTNALRRSPSRPAPRQSPVAAAEKSGGKGSRGVQAYQLLREAIATGRLKPGERVLETDVARMLGMSRTPIREAIASLEADGLIAIDGARGRVVATMDYQGFMELYAVREVLESTAAALAARNASDMEILSLRNMLEREAQLLDDAGRLIDHNRRFHEAICYCSHNRYIVKMLQDIRTGMLLLHPGGLPDKERPQRGLQEHRAIVDAIESRDPAAAEAAIRQHVRHSQQSRIKMLLQSDT